MHLSVYPRLILIIIPPLLAVLPPSSQANEDDLITACHQMKTGNLRVVGDEHDCGPAENVIYWNRTGIQGPPGPEGPPGIPGPSGALPAYNWNNKLSVTNSPTIYRMPRRFRSGWWRTV